MTATPRLGRRAVRAMLIAAIAVLGLAALALNLPGGGGGGPFKGDTMPALYAPARIQVADRLITAPQARARAAFARWVAAHPVRDDRAFTAFALQSVGPPPGPAVQRRELAELHRIDAGRTPAGERAAVWLENHGKKDVWKLFFKQYAQLAGKTASREPKKVFKATYKLGNALALQGKDRFARPSPYITDPSLHALNQGKATRKFSYPAKHAILSLALATVLAHDEPERAQELRWMADEVLYSRMYAGGHYPSDVAAGAYIGTLVGLYEDRFAATA